MPQFDFEQYIRDVVDEHIDISQLAMDVSQEITISPEIIHAEIDEYLDENRITELVDVDVIADAILNNNLSAIEEGLDYHTIADNVYERISISDIADDVIGNHLGDIMDSIDYNLITENVLSDIDYQEIVCNVTKHQDFVFAVKQLIAEYNSAPKDVPEEKNFIMGPYDRLEDPKESQVLMHFTKDQLKDIVIASILGAMNQSNSNGLHSTPADELYDKVVSIFPYQIREFLNRKDR